jgi:signal transduction histidine kinase/DNA-binding response OmpR family regulator
MNKISLIQRFSVVSLVITVTVALMHGYFIGNRIEKDMLSIRVNDLSDIVQKNVVKHLKASELTEPKLDKTYQKFSHKINHLSLGPNVIEVKIWNKDLKIVWSADQEMAGKQFPDEDGVRRAFTGEVVSELESIDEIKQKYKYENLHHLLEAYVPIRYKADHEVAAVFEVYENFDHHYETIMSHKRDIWIYSASGSAVIYILLFSLVWRASKLIDMQNKEIAQANQDWNETFNSMKDLITVHDSNYNIVRANKAADEELKLPELNNHKTVKCFKFYHGTEQPPEGCPSSSCFQSGGIASFELYEPYLDQYIHITSIPKINKDNKVVGLIHIARNITQQKADEEEKKKLVNQLIQTQKMESIGNLAGGIAHDFNNIISVIIGYSEIALKTMKEDNDLRGHLSTIHAAGEKAAALTGELLAFSRKQILEMKALNINSVIDNMTNILKRLIRENIKFDIIHRESINNVLGDKTQLEQVLLNLAVNARDAMPAGGHLTIRTFSINFKRAFDIGDEHIKPGSYMVLSVRDTGTGISSAVKEKMFEPFFSTKEVGKGTGMGLATVYGIVKQHSGHITIHSKLGEGTVFKIYIPFTDMEVEDDSVKQLNASAGNETILVVDDEPLLKDLIQEMLAPLGYNVLTASDGEDALQFIASYDGRIDLLLTDVIMPGMNGRDLAVEVLIERPEIKVIFMSGYTDDVLANHGVLAEGITLLNKPIKSNVLAIKIREVLDSGLHELQSRSAHEKLKGLNILLADDNEDISKLIKAFLEDYKCNIDIAENGRVALEKFMPGRYDLVLMDMQMPVMDGLTATKEIRTREKETRAEETTIIALTGNASREKVNECLNAGCSNHLAKPIKREQLFNALVSNTSIIQHSECTDEKEQVEKIVAHVNKDLEELIPKYLKERQNDINRIHEAIKEQDYEAIRSLGHTLKGSGGGYGFDQITEIGIHLEDSASESNREDIEKYANELSHYIENVDIIYE